MHTYALAKIIMGMKCTLKINDYHPNLLGVRNVCTKLIIVILRHQIQSSPTLVWIHVITRWPVVQLNDPYTPAKRLLKIQVHHEVYPPVA